MKIKLIRDIEFSAVRENKAKIPKGEKMWK